GHPAHCSSPQDECREARNRPTSRHRRVLAKIHNRKDGVAVSHSKWDALSSQQTGRPLAHSQTHKNGAGAERHGLACIQAIPQNMSELYSHLHEELQLRLDEAERVGYGFVLPASKDVSVVPKSQQKNGAEVAA